MPHRPFDLTLFSFTSTIQLPNALNQRRKKKEKMSKEALYEPVPSSRLQVFSTPIKSATDDHQGHDGEYNNSIDHDRYAPDHRRHPDNYPQLQRVCDTVNWREV